MRLYQALKRKVYFTTQIVALGADARSRFILFVGATVIQLAFYVQKHGRPFSFVVQTHGHKAHLTLTGTIDELHQLHEIFVDQCYALSTKEPRTILDLGANIGIASVWFALCYPAAHIIAYEPNPDLFEMLEKNTNQFSTIQLKTIALSAQNSTVTFYKSTRSVMSSLHPVAYSTPIQVPAISLDNAIIQAGGTVDIIKMDIEGGEFSVLAASTLLSNVSTIIGEAHPLEEGRSLQELRHTLEKTHTIQMSTVDRKSLFTAALRA